MLTVAQLRYQTYASWELLCSTKGVYFGALWSVDLDKAEADRLPWTNEVFKGEIRRQYGDLRCRETWEKAAIALTAHQMAQSYLEPYQILGYMASPDYMRCAIRQNYGDRLIDAMLQFPEMLEIIQTALEQLYRDDGQQEEKEIATAFLQSLHQKPFAALVGGECEG